MQIVFYHNTASDVSMKILFVCTGNICRSPSAEGVLRARLAARGLNHITVDSAGTHGYHIGEAPDRRSIAAARKRGIDISGLRARKVLGQDFSDFDLILALDEGHFADLTLIKPKNSACEVDLFLKYAGITHKTSVPDPYYGNLEGFEQVLDLIEEACDAMVEKLIDKRKAV